MPRRLYRLIPLLIGSPAIAASLNLTVGVDFSNYTEPDAVENSMPVSLSYRTLDWAVDISTSWLHQRRVPYGPEVLSKSDLRPLRIAGKTYWVPIRPPKTAITDNVMGWGDTTLGASRTFDLGDTEDAPYLSVRAAVKAPTGSKEKGFSTGKTDWSLGSTLSREIGPASLSASLARNLIGRRTGISQRNTWSGDVFAGYLLNDGTSLGLDYGWSQSPILGAESSRTLAWSASFALGKANRLSVTLSQGFAPSDPHDDFNVSLSHAFR